MLLFNCKVQLGLVWLGYKTDVSEAEAWNQIKVKKKHEAKALDVTKKKIVKAVVRIEI